VREIISATGALDYTENLISELLEASLASLHTTTLDPQAHEVLEGLAYAATRRTV